MRIGIIAPPWIPIPPPAYGGIEQVVDLHARGLAEAGHDVTLVAAPGTRVPGVEVLAPLAQVPDAIGCPVAERQHVAAARRLLRGVDVVIDHTSPRALQLLPHGREPLLHVVHGPIVPSARRDYRRTTRREPNVGLVAISGAQRRSAHPLPFVGVCHNGIDISQVPYSDRHDGYLAFLGRMSPDKGVEEAIRIARRIGLPLKIAAKCREPDERRYFDERVAPWIGPDVQWLGEIGRREKYQLLAGAAALVFPIAWEEPFGLVMIEAMACGTPVLATARGAVPEVVVDGTTGVVRAHAADLAISARHLDAIDREQCRAHVERRFSHTRMAARMELLAGRHAQGCGQHTVRARWSATGNVEPTAA